MVRGQKTKASVKSACLRQVRKLRYWLLTFDFCFALAVLPQAVPPQNNRPLAGVVELLAVGPGGPSRNRECAATGFLVNADGYLITNAHVVEDMQHCLHGFSERKILAKPPAPGGTIAPGFSCDVVALDAIHDLALLKLVRPLGPGVLVPVSLAARERAVGTAVTVSGHPEFAWQPRTQSGQVVWRGALRLAQKSSGTTEVFVVNIPLRPGNSGSPIYLETGDVVGVVVQSDQTRRDHSVAICTRHVIELLDGNGVKWYAADQLDGRWRPQ